MGLTVDLKCRGDENRGIYYEETKRCLIFLSMHETLEDVYRTITHEVIHHCIRDYEDIDEEQEEKLIFCMNWAILSIS